MRIQLKAGQIIDIEGASLATDVDDASNTLGMAGMAGMAGTYVNPHPVDAGCACKTCQDVHRGVQENRRGVQENRREIEENRWRKFRADIASAINRSSLENGSNTPDYMLASFLADVLMAFNKLTTARDNWKAQ